MTSTASRAPSAIASRRSDARASDTTRSRSDRRARPPTGVGPAAAPAGSSPPRTPRTDGDPPLTPLPLAPWPPALSRRIRSGWSMTETAASSSGVPISVTSSPALTRVSRPGQTSTSPVGGTTATGASAPYSSRSVAACGAVVRAARNRIPDSDSSWTPSPRQTSTTDGADRPATSSTATPASRTARPTAGLASCAITRTSARSRRTSSAVSSADRSFSWAQIDRDRAGQARRHQRLLGPGLSGDQRHVPQRDHPGEGRRRVVVDDHGAAPRTASAARRSAARPRAARTRSRARASPPASPPPG